MKGRKAKYIKYANFLSKQIMSFKWIESRRKSLLTFIMFDYIVISYSFNKIISEL